VSKERLNALYAAYAAVADDPAALAAVLVAVRSRAVIVMRDEDAAQEFTIGVWQALPIANVRDFSAWLNVRLRTKRLNWIRDTTRPHEILFCEMDALYEH